ncbi:6-phosphogluconolactonase [Rathayibacter toxicus]|uniref:6-phosphogluconolactonase n=1 Tax=Rathayibacter toxicus TaxID=145458 RepID=UPI001C053238|nr:6-phosphogluconolactonase [Rathayibacter toxicus]QWL32234.1 6-phosphogluconolactonase [Rathayibacter toxicus]QWL34327.1 6-phosphogluconolactonase [Rathayibacter toxicus]QWL36460.1 6-phosphogluconolactonase [Rathayibacter toxicus]QWL38550.1 6-phosphogluconolactonase [Rathayibacter toxicus]QWL40638.1 6-phosphogluconolactonase [Rathayibacter toxicus]
MTNERRVLVHRDKQTLAGSVAARFLTKTIDILDDRGSANVVLTGGTMGAATLTEIATSSAAGNVDWSRVHFWWGDERWVPRGHEDRNDVQAGVLFSTLNVPTENVHPYPGADQGLDLDEAAAAYDTELRQHAAVGSDYPRFDITFLGVGPDGHIASLFPERSAVRSAEVGVLPVRNSPKPPLERLTLTLPLINQSDRVWLVLAGADKASALGLALAGAHTNEVPAAGAVGRKRTVFFVDQEAAAEVPESLIAPSY